MSERKPEGDVPVGMSRFSPHGVIDEVIRRGKPTERGFRPYIEALAYARWQGWDRLELEQYVKLEVLLSQQEGPLDADVAERLREEITETKLAGEIEVVLRVLVAALSRLEADSPCVDEYIRAFESRMDARDTAWRSRVWVGDFLRTLARLDAERAEQCQRRLTRRLPDWTLDYHGMDALEDFDLRSRATFAALLAAGWSDDHSENVESDLDGAFRCAVDKLMQASRLEWFEPFIEQLSAELRCERMYRRLSPETLYRVTETLSATRRRVYERNPRSALAVTRFEEALHRPHRRQLERGSLKLELELPGTRGFGEGVRLRLFDISRDGCLAVTEGPARFAETAPAREFQLDRGPGRTYAVRRLTGVLTSGELGDFTVRPGTELLLHDRSKDDREWAAIDGASLVRFTSDAESGRLWLGFHFDRTVPEVQQELENLVYQAA
ncbi:MAG: hypothetical protein AMK75_01045 [Planctomycetes bacterium SM23_65]|nr:MAG: hypothetical protein AMK75_01045 [Planctomycetes bacterium SM23_65]